MMSAIGSVTVLLLSRRRRTSPQIVDCFRCPTSCELLVEARAGSHRPGRRESTVANSVEHHLLDNEPRAGWLDVEVSPGVRGGNGADAADHLVISNDLEDLGVLVGERQSVGVHRRTLVIKRPKSAGLALRAVLAPVVGQAGSKGLDVAAVIGRPRAPEQLCIRVLH